MTTIHPGQVVRMGPHCGGWIWEGKEYDVPVGTKGKIVEGRRGLKGKPGCAIRFQGYSHPKYFDFPMTEHEPGKSPLPDWLEVVEEER